MSKSILVVEDNAIQASSICAYLTRKGWEVQTCASAEEGLTVWDRLRPDAVVTDHHLPRMTGVDMMERMRETAPALKCVVLTGDDTAQTAVRALKSGACDYVIKPVVLSELHKLLERLVGAGRAVPDKKPAEKQVRGEHVNSLIGESPAMASLKATISRLVEVERNFVHGDLPAVLISGETGTGKELVARSLHFDGARRGGPFMEINCASIPSPLLESELFGHERGAFTDARERRTGLVEAADGGTLFLDEIGEIEPSLQAKLLKLLEEKTIRRIGSVKERKVDLRIISATNRDLEAMVREGRFRGDLYFRLRVVSVQIPALRDRGDDILLLARHFLALHGRNYGKPDLRFAPDAECALLRYYWPGNVREMRNMLEQTALLATGDVVAASQLALCTGLAPGATGNGAAAVETAGDRERSALAHALERTDWNVAKTARLLGLTRDMMRYRIEKWKLSRPPEEAGPR